MNIFGNSNLSIVNLAMLSYPVTGLTIDDKLALLKKKQFTRINPEKKSELDFEKRTGNLFYEKLITSNGYQIIEIPPFIQELTCVIKDDASWYTYYETNSREKFEALFRYKHHQQYLIYYIKTAEKIISYYRVRVRQMASDVVIIEVIEETNTIPLPGREGVGKFYVRSFLSADDFNKKYQYPNETLKLPIDKLEQK